MFRVVVFFALLVAVADAAKACQGEELPKDSKLRIGVKKRADDCARKAKNGDRLSMHYTGTLFSDCSEFDSSRTRDPFSFTLGNGEVIQGWDQGLRGMCVGEQRKLTIPSDLGYGDSGSGDKIPGGSTLVFDVELIDIQDASKKKKKRSPKKKKKAKKAEI